MTRRIRCQFHVNTKTRQMAWLVSGISVLALGSALAMPVVSNDSMAIMGKQLSVALVDIVNSVRPEAIIVISTRPAHFDWLLGLDEVPKVLIVLDRE